MIETEARTLDKKFIVAHGIYLSSVVFDVESTHMGLAHHKCHEGDFGGGRDPNPSRGKMYANFTAWFAVVTAGDYLIAKTHPPKWLPLQYVVPTYETTIHFKGALSWYGSCW